MHVLLCLLPFALACAVMAGLFTAYWRSNQTPPDRQVVLLGGIVLFSLAFSLGMIVDYGLTRLLS